MKLLRFDLTGGASGDMILGALLSLGADAPTLEKTLSQLLGQPIGLRLEPADSHGIHGHRLSVCSNEKEDAASWPGHDARHGGAHHHHGHGGHGHCAWAHVDALLASTPLLSENARENSRAVFRALARAEADIHGVAPEDARFHEVGAWDSIADIVGACLALEQLGVDALETPAFPCGVGSLLCDHGVMPNPAPATMRLLRGQTLVQTDEPFELVTPTGAALLTALKTFRGGGRDRPPRVLLRDAFSFGARTLRSRPNCLRAALHDAPEKPGGAAFFNETLTLLETNLDDCNPQWLPDTLQRLLDAGANDAWITQAVMKKGRPGFVLSALARPALAETLAEVMFRALPTLGVRATAVARAALDRRVEARETPLGPLRVKIGSLNGEDLTRSPEFADCARLARENGLFPRGVARLAGKENESNA